MKFSIFPIMYFSINTIINIYIYKNINIHLEKKNILIIGDSHIEKALDPNKFYSAHNIAQSAEPYILTYWKLKKILEYYVPDTLLIGFSHHNISKFNDYKFSNKIWSTEMFKRSYIIEDFKSINKKIPIDYYEYYKFLWKKISFYPHDNHIHFLGSYKINNLTNINNWNSAINRHFYYNNNELNISNISKDYLDSLLIISKKYNILPILIGSPVHENYFNNIPDNLKIEFNALKNSYEDIIIIDNIQLFYPDSLFLNTDHLNSYGSSLFTEKIISELKHNKNEKN